MKIKLRHCRRSGYSVRYPNIPVVNETMLYGRSAKRKFRQGLWFLVQCVKRKTDRRAFKRQVQKPLFKSLSWPELTISVKWAWVNHFPIRPYTQHFHDLFFQIFPLPNISWVRQKCVTHFTGGVSHTAYTHTSPRAVKPGSRGTRQTNDCYFFFMIGSSYSLWISVKVAEVLPHLVQSSPALHSLNQRSWWPIFLAVDAQFWCRE